MAGRCRGGVPTEGAQLLPSFLFRSFSSVAVTTTCPQKAGEKRLWPVAMSTVLPLPAESRELVGMATLLGAPGDARWGTGSLEKAQTLVPKGMRGQERPMQSHIYLENFVL